MTSDGGAVTAVVRFAPDPRAVAGVRRFLTETLSRWRQPRAMLDIASLLGSELAGNAVRHGRGLVTVTARLRRDAVRVEVNDASHDLPQVAEQGPEREHGRGMWLVEQLSSRWGSHICPGDGKDVWFELETTNTQTGLKQHSSTDHSGADPAAADAGRPGGR